MAYEPMFWALHSYWRPGPVATGSGKFVELLLFWQRGDRVLVGHFIHLKQSSNLSSVQETFLPELNASGRVWTEFLIRPTAR